MIKNILKSWWWCLKSIGTLKVQHVCTFVGAVWIIKALVYLLL